MAIDLLQRISEVRMMTNKMHISPISSTHESRLRVPFTSREDAKFFRSWLVYDSDLETTRTRGINWNMIAGLVLIAVVSGAGWFGIGLLLRHFLK
jgi:hypothetical protein